MGINKVNRIFMFIALFLMATIIMAQTSPSVIVTTDEDRAINWNNGTSIARASNGALMVVYGTSADSLTYAVTYDSDFGIWNTPEAIGKGSIFGVQIQTSAKVVADADNNFHVVWSENYQLRYSKYDGSTWTTPVHVPNTSAPWDTIQCAMNAIDIDSEGNVWIVWATGYENDDLNEWIFASKSSDGVTWSGPDTLFTDVMSGSLPNVTYGTPYIGTGPDGKVGVTLRGPQMGPKNKYTGIFQEYDGSAWGTTELVSDFNEPATGDTVAIYQVSVDYDSYGNRHFAFYTHEGDFSDKSLGQIFYIQKSAAGNWSTAVRTTAFPDGSCDYPAITVGENDALYIVFFAKDPAGILRMYGVASGNSGVTWSDTLRLSDNTVSLDARGPSISKYVSATGADVLWLQKTSDSAVDELYYGLIPFVEYVTVDNAVAIPKSYRLLTNYPNPFNPETNIRFNVVSNGLVELVIYNALGQQVAELIKTEMEAGIHEIKFNASDLQSGVYFYRLTNGDVRMTKKLLYLK
ncbi:MAG: T9SS type A sorting domain-containing protein [Candidatus Neomarinimicrobiota bacterium]